MTMRSLLWQNIGLYEMQSRIYVVNRWKKTLSRLFSLSFYSVNSWRTSMLALPHSNTTHQKHGMSQSVMNAGESQWEFDYPAIKHVVRCGIIWIRNGLCRSLSSFHETSQRISPLWELLPSNLSWRPIGSRQSKWLANCREACKYELERQYKCGAHDNYVRIFFLHFAEPRLWLKLLQLMV